MGSPAQGTAGRQQLPGGLIGQVDGAGGIHGDDRGGAGLYQNLDLLFGVFALADLFGELLQMFHHHLAFVHQFGDEQAGARKRGAHHGHAGSGVRLGKGLKTSPSTAQQTPMAAICQRERKPPASMMGNKYRKFREKFGLMAQSTPAKKRPGRQRRRGRARDFAET